jgi:hypothetical protein
MRKSLGCILIFTSATITLALAGCERGSVFADRQPQVEVPEGAQVVVRLVQGIDSSKNTSGETFQAKLDQPIKKGEKILAPAGSEVTGKLTHVEEAGRVKGLARITLTLKTLTVGEKDHDLDTSPLTIEAAGSGRKDIGIVAGTAAVGAIIGAIAGGGKGAAIGAGAGAGAGTGAVLYTRGNEVKFDPETRFAFRLKSPLELPVFQK